MQIKVFKIVGVSPLLMNNPKQMIKGESGVNVKKRVDEKEEAEKTCYRNEDGNLYVPSNWFRASMLKGAMRRKIGKYMAGSLVSGGVFNTEPEIELLSAKNNKTIKDYSINIARCVIQKAGILKARAEVRDWACLLPLEIDNDLLTNDHVLEILNIAGKVAGVGDWRPEKKGIYGRFKAEFYK